MPMYKRIKQTVNNKTDFLTTNGPKCGLKSDFISFNKNKIENELAYNWQTKCFT